MSDWAQGYVTEIPYTYGYYAELQPNSIDFALRSKGFRPPSEGKSEMRYLELGCGQGLTANIVATLNPNMSVTAVDFHPGHIAEAQALAREAALTNVTFVEADFSDFERSLPRDVKFDYITMHGVLSWVAPQVRDAILAIVQHHLAPGGAVYVSYNALPGASSRALINQVFSRLTDPAAPALRRVDDGLAVLDKLLASGAVSARSIADKVKKLREHSSRPAYLAHEYLNSNAHPFYCTQVFDLFRPAKVAFCASGDMLSHVDLLHFDDHQRGLLNHWQEREAQELAGDLIRDTGFRRDILVRGPVSFNIAQQQTVWLQQRFLLGRHPDAMQYNIVTSRGQVTLPPDLYPPLAEHFSGGPTSLAEAMFKPELAQKSLGDLADALRVLVALGALSPLSDRHEQEQLRARTDRLNAALLARSPASSDIQFLVSPLLERAIDCGWFEQLLLQGERLNARSPAAFAAETVGRHGRRFVQNGRELDSPPEKTAYAEQQANDFFARKRPLLAHLGVCLPRNPN